jgi:hypothetical protein
MEIQTGLNSPAVFQRVAVALLSLRVASIESLSLVVRLEQQWL